MAMNSGRSSATVRAWFFVAVTLGCAVLAAVIGVTLASRYSYRTDLSVIGGRRLAQRSERVLRSLDGELLIVVAAELSAADRQARERLADVLDEFSRTNGKCRSALIDTATGAGVQSYQQLIADLVSRDAAAISTSSSRLEAARADAAALAAYLSGTLSPALQRLESSISVSGADGRAARDYFNQTAAAVRLAARDLDESCVQAAESLKSTLAGKSIPRTDLASASLVKGLNPAISLLEAVGKELKAFGARVPDAAAARELASALQARRDQGAVTLDSLRRLERPDVLRIVDALGSGSAALVVSQGGKGLVALDVQALLPSAAWLAASGAEMADQSRRIEELLISGIGALQSKVRPIVVFVHGENREFLREAPVLSLATQRLESRGIDVVEWACVANPAAPSLADLDPDATRPVVYVAMSADSASDAGKNAGKGALTGVQRCEKLAKTLERLVAEGRNVCVSLNPSIVATYGDKDPIALAIAPLGLVAETGKPLMREQVNGAGRAIVTDMVVQASASTHPLAEAVRGLPTTLPWAIALRSSGGESGTKVWPIMTLPGTAGIWGESQWLAVWQTPRDRRSMMSELPRPDATRDQLEPLDGASWMVAAACERKLPSGTTQRAVVVGANSWLIDQVAGRSGSVDGRQVALSPGNLELFENAIWYLCGRDELIAQSAAASTVAIVQPIDEHKLVRVRLAIIVGLPGLTLLLGLFYRVWRG